MSIFQDDRIIVKTLSGLEDALVEELQQIGASQVTALRRAVECRGDQEILYKINYQSRLGLVVIKPLKTFYAETPDQLYEGVRSIDWMKIFDIGKTISVKASTYKSALDHTQYISQKTKDAIVDYFRDKFGHRPSVDTFDADIQINIHLNENQCEIGLNSSGNPLFKRGYRQATGIAPINEVLAAGLIALSGWDKKSNFIDPMCGSGTLAIEAAMLSQNIPSGYYRDHYSFFHWSDYERFIWKKVKEEADSAMIDYDGIILATDISPKSIEIAEKNIQYAKLHKDIQLKQIDIKNLNYPEGNGVIIINPPYGERIKTKDISDLYQAIGDNLKLKATGYDAWVISSDLEAIRLIGLRPHKRHIVFNGSLECRFNGFKVFKGSKKDQYQ